MEAWGFDGFKAWRRLGSVLEASWEPLGISWDLLGASWEPLGASWGLLGRSWEPLGFLIDFGVDFGRQKGPKKGPKMDPKTIQNRNQILSRNKMLSKTLLEPSWADIGPFWGPAWSSKVCSPSNAAHFLKNHIFFKNRVPRTVLGPTWTNLGAQECPKGSSNSVQNGSPKTIKK